MHNFIKFFYYSPFFWKDGFKFWLKINLVYKFWDCTEMNVCVGDNSLLISSTCGIPVTYWWPGMQHAFFSPSSSWMQIPSTAQKKFKQRMKRTSVSHTLHRDAYRIKFCTEGWFLAQIWNLLLKRIVYNLKINQSH